MPMTVLSLTVSEKEMLKYNRKSEVDQFRLQVLQIC